MTTSTTKHNIAPAKHYCFSYLEKLLTHTDAAYHGLTSNGITTVMCLLLGREAGELTDLVALLGASAWSRGNDCDLLTMPGSKAHTNNMHHNNPVTNHDQKCRAECEKMTTCLDIFLVLIFLILSIRGLRVSGYHRFKAGNYILLVSVSRVNMLDHCHHTGIPALIRKF